MRFAVGDNVVHPHHGPGRITGLERKDLLAGTKRYYVIEIPAKGLTVYVPRRSIHEAGVRPAISQAKLARVLNCLEAEPTTLPQDYKERQEQVWEKLKTALAMQVAEVVRDLTWHERRFHLTRKDADLLSMGRRRLCAEMALVSGSEISEMEEMIDRALALPPKTVDQKPLVSSVVQWLGNA